MPLGSLGVAYGAPHFFSNYEGSTNCQNELPHIKLSLHHPLLRYCRQHQDRDRDHIVVAYRSLGPVITSFVLILPQFFGELQSLSWQGAFLPILVGGADCTFQVEWRGYVFGMLYVSVRSKLSIAATRTTLVHREGGGGRGNP
jgi:hypothetical protein